MVRERTGRLDPYFSGTKFARMLRDRSVVIMATLRSARSIVGLSEVTNGEVHVTDPTNASRTMLYNIVEHRWDDDLCDALNVPIGAFRGSPVVWTFRVDVERPGVPDGIPIAELPATSRRRCSGKPASAKEWPRTPMAPAVLFFSTWEQVPSRH